MTLSRHFLPHELSQQAGLGDNLEQLLTSLDELVDSNLLVGWDFTKTGMLTITFDAGMEAHILRILDEESREILSE